MNHRKAIPAKGTRWKASETLISETCSGKQKIVSRRGKSGAAVAYCRDHVHGDEIVTIGLAGWL